MLQVAVRKRTGAGDQSPKQTTAVTRRLLASYLRRQMREELAVPARTKRTAARLAVVAAIRAGHIEQGGLLPPEKALSKILGVSLGTTQAALRQLQQTGTIVRRRGDGTRVASSEPLSQTVWHFRFLDKETMRPVRFVSQEVEIARTTAAGPWSDFLPSARSFVRIARRMLMSDGATSSAEMFLDEASAGGLLDIAPHELDMVNIRPYLEEAFGLQVVSARHRVQTTRLTPATARATGLRAGTQYFEIHALAFLGEGTPAYFQRIYAESSRYVLDL